MRRVRTREVPEPPGRLLLKLALSLQVVACILAGMYIATAYRASTNDIRLHGELVRGTVIGIMGSMEVEYFVDGRQYRDRVVCGWDRCVHYDRGGEVLLKVNPTNPRQAVLAENPFTAAGTRVAGFVAPACAAGAGLCVWLLRRSARRKQTSTSKNHPDIDTPAPTAGRSTAPLLVLAVIFGFHTVIVAALAAVPGNPYGIRPAILLGAISLACFTAWGWLVLKDRRRKRLTDGQD